MLPPVRNSSSFKPTVQKTSHFLPPILIQVIPGHHARVPPKGGAGGGFSSHVDDVFSLFFLHQCIHDDDSLQHYEHILYHTVPLGSNLSLLQSLSASFTTCLAGIRGAAGGRQPAAAKPPGIPVFFTRVLNRLWAISDPELWLPQNNRPDITHFYMTGSHVVSRLWRSLFPIPMFKLCIGIETPTCMSVEGEWGIRCEAEATPVRESGHTRVVLFYGTTTAVGLTPTNNYCMCSLF